MTKHIKINDFVPPVDREYDGSVYPGDGLYLTAAGQLTIAYSVSPSATRCVMGVPASHQIKVDDGAPAGGGGGVDAHLLLDQVLRLAGK